MDENEENSQEGVQGSAPDGASKTEQKGPPETVPYSRLQEVISERNTLSEQVAQMKDDLEKFKKEQEDERQRKLEDNQQFKELADEWKSKYGDLEPRYAEALDRIKANEAALSQYADAQMASVPEIFQDVVKKLPLLERLTWLAENADKLTKASAPIPSTPKGQGPGKLPEDERRRRAARTF